MKRACHRMRSHHSIVSSAHPFIHRAPTASTTHSLPFRSLHLPLDPHIRQLLEPAHATPPVLAGFVFANTI